MTICLRRSSIAVRRSVSSLSCSHSSLTYGVFIHPRSDPDVAACRRARGFDPRYHQWRYTLWILDCDAEHTVIAWHHPHEFNPKAYIDTQRAAMIYKKGTFWTSPVRTLMPPSSSYDFAFRSPRFIIQSRFCTDTLASHMANCALETFS